MVSSGICLKKMEDKITAQQIVDGVVKMIREGRFCPGKPIREIELCKEFNVSRTPVREALRLLQNSGVVKYVPRCGVQVVEMDEKDLLFFTDIRTALETVSTREAASNITPDDIKELRSINDKFLDNKDSDYDTEFHMAIARISGNNCLIEYLKNLHIRQALVKQTIPMKPERYIHSYEEHEAIIQALELKDPELAAKQADIHFHISQASLQNKLRKYLSEK